MGIIQQFSLGWNTYKQAHAFIKEHELYRLFILPVLINALLLGVMVWLGVGWAESLTEWIYSLIGWNPQERENWSWYQKALYWSVSIIMNFTLFIVYLSVVRYLMLILIAPILAYVSERTEEIASGKAYPFSLRQLLTDTKRGIIIALKNGMVELIITVLLLALAYVPIIGWLTPLLLFILQSYFFGFSMLDYFFERQKLDADASRRLIFSYKWVAIANGAFFNGAVYLITFVIAILPFVLALIVKTVFIVPVIFLSILPIYSVVAGTLAAMEVGKKELPYAPAR